MSGEPASRRRAWRHGDVRRRARGGAQGTKRTEPKKAVVLISDGNDTNSRGGLRDVRQAVRRPKCWSTRSASTVGEPDFGTPPPTFPPTPIPFPDPLPRTPGTRWPGLPLPPHHRRAAAGAHLNARRFATSPMTAAAERRSCATRAISSGDGEHRRRVEQAVLSATPAPGRATAAGTPSVSKSRRDPVQVRARRGYAAS